MRAGAVWTPIATVTSQTGEHVAIGPSTPGATAPSWAAAGRTYVHVMEGTAVRQSVHVPACRGLAACRKGEPLASAQPCEPRVLHNLSGRKSRRPPAS